MPKISGFTTKNPNWKDQVFDAINDDPNAKMKLSFSATNFKVKKNPLKKLKDSKIVDSKGAEQKIKKVLFFV